MKTIKEMNENRGRLISQRDAIRDKAVTEKRDMTAEELTQWEALDADQEREMRAINVQVKLDKEAVENEQRRKIENPDPETNEELNKKENRAFAKFLRKQTLTPDDQRSLAGIFQRLGNDPSRPAEMRIEQRDYQSTTAAAGGYTVPQGFMAELERAMLPYLPMIPFSRIIKTKTGVDMPWPMMNDTSNKGELLGETSGAATNVPLVFTNKVLKAYMFDSKVILISLQLLQDSALPIEQIIAEACAERLGRIKNQYFTTGTEQSQPGGYAYMATDCGIHCLKTAIAYDDIVALEMSVNADYRKNGTFSFSDSILKALKMISVGTSDNRPLWQAGLMSAGMTTPPPEMILGHPYFVNNEMSGLGSGNTVMSFGDMQKFVIREVTDFTLFRFDELYMVNLSVGFLGYERASSHLLDAGTHPIKIMKCGNT
jgi:HK97 family phage major capsid protein